MGTAIVGIVGLAIGLNVIGVIIGGILGALLGAYAGRQVAKPNALKGKRLLAVHLEVLKFAALSEYIIAADKTKTTAAELR